MDSAVTPCSAHPRQPAVVSCMSCGKPLCTLCSFEVAGQSYCADCGQAAARAAAPPPPRTPILPIPQSSGFPSLGLTAAAAAAPPVPERPAAQCADHPDNPAVSRCRLCGKAICATCDFDLPGGVHLCPSCVETSQTAPAEISPKRKKMTYLALGFAAWSTVMLVLMFGGAFNSFFTEDAAGKLADLVITNLTLWPLLLGAALSIGAMDRRLRSTAAMKVALWWNGILGGLFLLFIIAANLGAFG
jgi:hypothetical protein